MCHAGNNHELPCTPPCIALFSATAIGVVVAQTEMSSLHLSTSGLISVDLDEEIRTLVAQGNLPSLQEAVVSDGELTHIDANLPALDGHVKPDIHVLTCERGLCNSAVHCTPPFLCGILFVDTTIFTLKSRPISEHIVYRIRSSFLVATKSPATRR